MKTLVALCLVTLIVNVYSENCQRVGDCHETQCSTDHGWWLHCTKGTCLCTHDSFVSGKPCTDGQASTCEAIHGSRCQNNNLNWHCVDGSCHCSKV